MYDPNLEDQLSTRPFFDIDKFSDVDLSKNIDGFSRPIIAKGKFEFSRQNHTDFNFHFFTFLLCVILNFRAKFQLCSANFN